MPTTIQKLGFLILGAGLVFNGVQALAGGAVDAATKAEALATEGKNGEALAAIEEAREAIWSQMPMSFGKVLFVASDPQGFGIYDIRDNSNFKLKDPLVVYFEPKGYGYGRDGDINIIDMKLDFEITSKAGESLHKQQGFANLTLRSRVPNKEFMGKITYDFSGLQPGEYVVVTTVNDVNSPKSASFSLPFVLAQ